MSQNSGGCGCNSNDWKLLLSNTGIAQISNANTSLTGSGAVTVLTAGNNGTTIHSVIVKAVAPVTEGMVRLFIQDPGGTVNTLYKEIPIPTTPAFANTPTPAPICPTFEILLTGGLKLQSGYKLTAATQTGQPFNVIAEGVDWKYPGSTPAVCCNFYATTEITGQALLTTGGTVVRALTAGGNNGTRIRTITIKALQSNNEGLIKLYMGPDTSHYSLFKEIYVPQNKQGGFEASFKQVIEMDFCINANYVIGAATLNSESFAVTVDAEDWHYGVLV